MAVNIAIYSKQTDTSSLECIAGLCCQLADMGVSVSLPQSYSALKLEGVADFFEPGHSLNSHTDFLLSVGGDGTFLDTVMLVKSSNIPILGINTGRLGFLASTPREETKQAIQDLLKGHYSKEKRSLLYLETDSDLFGDNNLALNDFVVHKKDTSSMITVHTYLNGEFLNSYWADGLIVATPTGSTGYSLSCGGPILFPDSASFAITPISPHNLNVRPVVVPDGSVISFEVEGRGNNFLISLDSRSHTVDSTIQIAVRKADCQLSIVKLHDKNHMDTLRKKMNWGADQRN
ncbi:MAG: NAD kinase [Flavobacteriaceae bacterium]|nr:NAD kinase [Flavobacteriaceae bacterium]